MAESKSETGSFQSDLHALLESGEGADVTLVVGDSQLLAHSLILAARSPVFGAMFRSDMQEAHSRRIEITDVREDVLRQVLRFVYTDTVPELENMAAELLAAADKYDLPLLKKRCEEQMARDVSTENAAATAALAVLHCCLGLRNAAVGFIASHPEVMASGGWARLLRDNADAAAEICRQLVVAPAQPTPQLAPSRTATKKTPTGPQSPKSRTVPKKLKQKIGARLLKAASSGREREVWALLAAGAPKDVQDVKWNTALHLAVTNGHASTVKCLLDGGLDANAANSSQQTPLHLAAQRGDTNIIWMLVAASARVDAQDSWGRTPLHVAVQRNTTAGGAQAVSALLLAGARKDIKDIYGRSPECLESSFIVQYNVLGYIGQMFTHIIECVRRYTM